jgi:hypothetical protein
LEVVQGRDATVARDEIAGEGDRRPIDLGEQADGSFVWPGVGTTSIEPPAHATAVIVQVDDRDGRGGEAGLDAS